MRNTKKEEKEHLKKTAYKSLNKCFANIFYSGYKGFIYENNIIKVLFDNDVEDKCEFKLQGYSDITCTYNDNFISNDSVTLFFDEVLFASLVAVFRVEE